MKHRNLDGQWYTSGIRGTKCPVTLETLKQWHWQEKLTTGQIAKRLEQDYRVIVNPRCVFNWFGGKGQTFGKAQKQKEFCLNCRAVMVLPPWEFTDGAKFCSMSCSGQYKGRGRSMSTALDGITCPRCLHRQLHRRWIRNGTCRFMCANCKRTTADPLIDPDLRDELERRGLLEGNRIRPGWLYS